MKVICYVPIMFNSLLGHKWGKMRVGMGVEDSENCQYPQVTYNKMINEWCTIKCDVQRETDISWS